MKIIDSPEEIYMCSDSFNITHELWTFVRIIYRFLFQRVINGWGIRYLKEVNDFGQKDLIWQKYEYEFIYFLIQNNALFWITLI